MSVRIMSFDRKIIKFKTRAKKEVITRYNLEQMKKITAQILARMK